MIPRPLDQVTAEDVLALIAEQRAEDRTIEYKLALPGGSDTEKREFLADVSSFANAAGGDLVYGIDEERDATTGKATGRPAAAPGLPGVIGNDVTLRLDNIIRSGVDPRIPGVHTRAIEGFGHGYPIVVVRVPRSWAGPHMVKESWRFFSRTSAGKYPLDVREIRAAFELSAGATDRMQRFISDRLGRIIAGETPVPLEPGGKVVLHLLPLAAFDSGALRAAPGYPPPPQHQVLPLYMDGSTRPNFDGLINYYLDQTTRRAESYGQLFRNGVIETVDGGFHAELDGRSMIRGALLVRHAVEGLGRYLRLEQALGLEPPFYLVLSMVGTKGFTVYGTGFLMRRATPIDRDVFSAPEVVIDNLAADPAAVLRGALDVVWQASGYERCFHYNQNGALDLDARD